MTQPRGFTAFTPAPARAGARRQRGIAAVEFALVFSLFFAVLYAGVTFGAAFYTQQVLTRAAEDGARAVPLLGASPDYGQITGVIQNSLAASLIAPPSAGTTHAQRRSWIVSNVTIGIDPACGGATGCVLVTINYPYNAGTRVLPSIPPFDSWVPSALHASVRAPTF